MSNLNWTHRHTSLLPTTQTLPKRTSKLPLPQLSPRARSGLQHHGQTERAFSWRLRTWSQRNTDTKSCHWQWPAKARMLGRLRLTLPQSSVTFSGKEITHIAPDILFQTDKTRFGVKYAEELYSQQPSHHAAGVWKYVYNLSPSGPI